MEVAPVRWRARLYTMTRAIGVLGVIFIPVMRTVFMQNDPTQWRLVYILPAILGLILVIPIITLLRESGVFLTNRIQLLSTPLATRLEEAAKNKDANKSALTRGFKFLFTDKQARNILIVCMVFYFATMALTGYYESIMNLGGMSTESITSALFVLPLMNALLTFIGGPIADKSGRKIAAVVLFITGVVGFILFNIAVQSGWSAYIVGALLGGYLGAYFVSGDMIGLILLESAPTEIRSSVSGAQGIMIMVSVLLSTVTIAIGVNFVDLAALCLIIAVPFLLTAMVLMMVLVKETNGVDLTTAGHSEA
jgi:MFS family permease